MGCTPTYLEEVQWRCARSNGSTTFQNFSTSDRKKLVTGWKTSILEALQPSFKKFFDNCISWRIFDNWLPHWIGSKNEKNQKTTPVFAHWKLNWDTLFVFLFFFEVTRLCNDVKAGGGELRSKITLLTLNNDFFFQVKIHFYPEKNCKIQHLELKNTLNIHFLILDVQNFVKYLS